MHFNARLNCIMSASLDSAIQIKLETQAVRLRGGTEETTMPEPNTQSANMIDVAIIGAGPYGLSVASHLAARRIPFRIFGDPMSAWAHQMPKGMLLKSDGFASSLADPESEFTLAHYCRREGLPYQDIGLPVPLEVFVSYGMAFQKKFVPNLENRMVKSVRQSSAGFELSLEGDERLFARNVVVATGIGYFAYIPSVLSELPGEFISHSSAHSDLQVFKGREVAVVGAGASALDLAALLSESGASVRVIARSSTIRFHDPPQARSIADRVLKPMTGLGAGMQMFFYSHAPLIFSWLPETVRLDRVRKVLGPAPGWFIKEKVVGKVPLHLGMNIRHAGVVNGRVQFVLGDHSEIQRTLEVDHVIAATGYRVDLQRLKILDPDLTAKINKTEMAPALSSNFESSVAGLYFVGVVAANTFGPLMRFAYGAGFTARQLSAHLAKRVHSEAMLKIRSANPCAPNLSNAPDAASGGFPPQ